MRTRECGKERKTVVIFYVDISERIHIVFPIVGEHDPLRMLARTAKNPNESRLRWLEYIYMHHIVSWRWEKYTHRHEREEEEITIKVIKYSLFSIISALNLGRKYHLACARTIWVRFPQSHHALVWWWAKFDIARICCVATTTMREVSSFLRVIANSRQLLSK